MQPVNGEKARKIPKKRVLRHPRPGLSRILKRVGSRAAARVKPFNREIGGIHELDRTAGQRGWGRGGSACQCVAFHIRFSVAMI